MDKNTNELAGVEVPRLPAEKSTEEKIVIMKEIIAKLERVEQLLNAPFPSNSNG